VGLYPAKCGAGVGDGQVSRCESVSLEGLGEEIQHGCY